MADRGGVREASRRKDPPMLARLLLALALLAPAPIATAQSRPCADRATVIERLESRFGEVRQAMGLNRSNAVFEVFASAETGTWTILVTTANGQTCLVASGDLWESEAGPMLGLREDV
jgi:hypothetical protein